MRSSPNSEARRNRPGGEPLNNRSEAHNGAAARSPDGPISQLISTGGWGEQLKPFIFSDFFNAEIEPGFGFAMHPHLGIATESWQPGTDLSYQDTTGKKGVLKAGGLEMDESRGRRLAPGFYAWSRQGDRVPAPVADAAANRGRLRR
jgi:hypothetical protein